LDGILSFTITPFWLALAAHSNGLDVFIELFVVACSMSFFLFSQSALFVLSCSSFRSWSSRIPFDHPARATPPSGTLLFPQVFPRLICLANCHPMVLPRHESVTLFSSVLFWVYPFFPSLSRPRLSLSAFSQHPPKGPSHVSVWCAVADCTAPVFEPPFGSLVVFPKRAVQSVSPEVTTLPRQFPGPAEFFPLLSETRGTSPRTKVAPPPQGSPHTLCDHSPSPSPRLDLVAQTTLPPLYLPPIRTHHP